jgi:putative membrane protein
MDLTRLLTGVLDSAIYTVLGVLLLVVAYKVVGAVVPFDLNKELSEDDNTAVGVFMAGIFIAVGLVIASAISG